MEYLVINCHLHLFFSDNGSVELGCVFIAAEEQVELSVLCDCCTVVSYYDDYVFMELHLVYLLVLRCARAACFVVLFIFFAC